MDTSLPHVGYEKGAEGAQGNPFFLFFFPHSSFITSFCHQTILKLHLWVPHIRTWAASRFWVTCNIYWLCPLSAIPSPGVWVEYFACFFLGIFFLCIYQEWGCWEGLLELSQGPQEHTCIALYCSVSCVLYIGFQDPGRRLDGALGSASSGSLHFW